MYTDTTAIRMVNSRPEALRADPPGKPPACQRTADGGYGKDGSDRPVQG